ncbi:MAG: hypothetical protein K2M47_07855 [Clostridiales bacterium]|nr:hypothetical protein [Clostridiales bacterium]
MTKKIDNINVKSDSDENNKIVIWCMKQYENLYNSFANIYYESVNPEIKFEVVGIDNAELMTERFRMEFESNGELPDMVITSECSEFIRQYSEIFLPLDDYIDTSVFASEGAVGNVINKENGNLMGYPISSGVVAFYYNRGIFEECEIEIPENYTIDAFIEYADKIKEQFGEHKYIIAHTSDLARIFMQSTGKLFYDNDGNIVYENVMELFDFFEALYNHGVILTDNTIGFNELIGLLEREEICGIIGAPYWIGLISNMVADNGLDQEWDVAHLPQSEPFVYNVSLYEEACLVVNKDDEEKQAIILDFLTQTFTANYETPRMMVEGGAIVPVTNFVCEQLDNVDYPECFEKNIYAYLAGMLPNIPPIEYGEDTSTLLEKLDKVTQQIMTGKINALTAYNAFVNDDPIPEEPNHFISIEVTQLPNKTEYYIYDQISLDGLVVEGIYIDGTRKVIKTYDLEIDPTVFDQVKEQQQVKISYWNGFKTLYTYFSVTVLDRKLVGISVENIRRVFLQDDILSNDDFYVEAIYDLGDSRRVTNFNILDRTLTHVGEKIVDFSYTERGTIVLCQKTIDVKRKLTGITIVKKPKDIMYYAGAGYRFDTTGMEVVASYSDGSQNTISNGQLVISPRIVKLKVGENTAKVTVQYEENGVEATAQLTVYKKTGVELDDCNITQDFGVSGSGAVNISSGELYYAFKDFTSSDSDFPIAISRTYKSDGGDHGVGTGWRLNLQQELINQGEQWSYIDKDGKKHTFSSGYSTADGRSDIRNEELGFDLFKAENGTVVLLDRSNNALVFKNVKGVYRLSSIHQYPSTPDNPIMPYCMQIEYDSSTGLITNVAAGRTISGKRRNVSFVYTGGLLTQLKYSFASSTVVAEYEYDGNVLTSIKKCNGNVNSPYSATTEFEITDSSFTVLDKSSKDGAGNYKSLIYTFGSNAKVSVISIGYGEDDRETTSVNYTGRIEPTDQDNHVTDIVASCYTEYNDILSVTSFNSQCSAATYSYEKGEDGTYKKPKKVYSASSCGFDYKALADSYSDTLDVVHDDFADNYDCGWSGGRVTTEKCICGSACFAGNQTLSKTYKEVTSSKNGEIIYLSLWVCASTSSTVSVRISNSDGYRSLSHRLDSGLHDKWQFTAFNLGKVAKDETITVTVSGINICIDDIRLTKAPYETPDDIAEPKYNAFGNIEKQYEYSPVDKKVACSTYKYNAEHQITEKAVTVDGKAHSKSVYEYKDGLLVSDREYGKGKGYFEETYAYSDYVQTKSYDSNGVLTENSEGIDWVQSVTGPQGLNSPSVAVKNTYYANSNFVKQVSSSDYVNNITYNATGALLSAQYGSAQSSDNRSEITFEYDTFGNMKRAIIGEIALVTCDYDYKHLNKITYANGGGIEYTYDSKNRVTAVAESGGYSATAVYGDDAEDTVTISDTNGVQYQSKTLNVGGKTTEYSASFEGDNSILRVVGLAMNGAGNISTTEIYTDDGETPFERLKTVVDRDGQLTQLNREYNGPSSAYSYDELYRLKNKSTTLSSTTFKTEYGYYGDNDERKYPRLFSETLSIGKTEDVFSYLYHANGNIATVLNNNKNYAGYAYDEYGRIISERNYFFDERYEYKYDVNGNIVSKTTYRMSDGATISTQVYDYVSMTVGCGQNAAWGDQLKVYNNDTVIQYDAYGNPIVYLGKHLTWNGRKLVKIDNTVMEYDYNAMRVKKGNRRYYWQGNNLRMEKDGTPNGMIYYYYDESGVCGMNLNGTDYYYRKNMLGDICAIYGVSGELVCRYVYDAWGNHRLYDKNGKQINDDGTTVGSKNPFRYRGYYWDREFGLYYLQSRYYDPAFGRFISPDGIDYIDPSSINGMNLYAYCGNNPIMNADPEGTVVGTILAIAGGIIFGSVMGGVFSGLAEKIAGGDFWDGFWGGLTNGLISTLGLALGGMVGGPLGFVIAGVFGFLGGVTGGIVTEGSKTDWNISNDYWSTDFVSIVLPSAGLNALTNILSVKLGNVMGAGNGIANPIKRFGSWIKFGSFAFSASLMIGFPMFAIGLIPLIIAIKKKEEEEEEQNGTT